MSAQASLIRCCSLHHPLASSLTRFRASPPTTLSSARPFLAVTLSFRNPKSSRTPPPSRLLTKLEWHGAGSPRRGAPARRFSGGVRSTQVSDSGSIDSPMMQAMEKKIKEQLNAEAVTVKDAYGDGRHVSIDVTSAAFEGQSAVNRQRMVYKAIWEELQSTVHAVDQMTTRTPGEAAESR